MIKYATRLEDKLARCVELQRRLRLGCEFCTSTTGTTPAAAAAAAGDDSGNTVSGCSEPKPFEDIPGPKSLPWIGTLYKYIPYIGEYSFKKLHKNGMMKLCDYGPLVKEEIVPGEPIVWVYQPDDIAEVFKADSGRHPERRSHRALYKYRTDRRHVYNTGGLLPTNGDDWWKLRKEFQKDLSKPQTVLQYIEDTDSAVNEFSRVCEKNDYEDALPLLSRLFLELTCRVAFDLKVNCFSDEEMRPDSMSSRLINAALTTNSVILTLDNGPRLWRYFNTPKYRKLIKSQMYMESIAEKFVTEKMERMKQENPGERSSLLEIYLKNPNLDKKDVIGMACDMLLAGIDTTAYTSAFLLYHLAQNRMAQERLYFESAKLMEATNNVITADTLKNAVYTKAVIKETMRLNPISVGVGRILQTDLVLNGYLVKKGTNVVTQNQVSCRLSDFFESPNDFVPERWLRDRNATGQAKIHPYLVLPFGHGPRSCIARRLAEQHMQILLLRTCKNLKFEWLGDHNLDVDSLLINKPSSAINLLFHRRL
ncbi:cytochrome P450 302a1, mitochondrial [Trichogramma pretiosum]|uniref:cytochrome P450 302a1, mitochondrial n=1 Tax=Trichogramma pretiosum TaxID=7493 RepID=UPI0006C9C952|nr:cytochrome P450 302a1, mitochondrial [Trichogramma pretiosum]